jgi:hypothetical protein
VKSNKEMNSKNHLPNTVTVTPGGDELGSLVSGKHHFLYASVDVGNKDVCLNFSTRRAMYDFAISLLHEAVYGNGGMVDGKGGLKEFLPSNEERVVDGVRVKEDSSRVFIFYNEG